MLHSGQHGTRSTHHVGLVFGTSSDPVWSMPRFRSRSLPGCIWSSFGVPSTLAHDQPCWAVPDTRKTCLTSCLTPARPLGISLVVPALHGLRVSFGQGEKTKSPAFKEVLPLLIVVVLRANVVSRSRMVVESIPKIASKRVVLKHTANGFAAHGKGANQSVSSSISTPDTPWDCHRTAAPLTPHGPPLA